MDVRADEEKNPLNAMRSGEVLFIDVRKKAYRADTYEPFNWPTIREEKSSRLPMLIWFINVNPGRLVVARLVP